MKKLFAIDSDGTLRHSDGSISERTKKIIKKMIDNNSIVVICTARPRYHTSKISNELEIKSYLISSNGTEIYDNFNKKCIWAEYIKPEIAKKILDYSIEMDLRIIFVVDNKEYATKFVRNSNQILLEKDNYEEILNKNIKQIMIIDSNKNGVMKLREELKKENDINIVDTSSVSKEEIWFSVISSKASKGIAVSKLANILNIATEDIVAIGNDYNDLSMFEVSGTSAVVENAENNIKKYASAVIPSNDEDGVAQFLENLINK